MSLQVTANNHTIITRIRVVGPCEYWHNSSIYRPIARPRTVLLISLQYAEGWAAVSAVQYRERFMHLTVREEERIQLWAAAEMARRRLERGVKLNYPETVALICDEILERAREGSIPMLTDMMEYGATIVKKADVMDGVADMLKIVQVEAVFPDGTKLVTVMNPVRD